MLIKEMIGMNSLPEILPHALDSNIQAREIPSAAKTNNFSLKKWNSPSLLFPWQLSQNLKGTGKNYLWLYQHFLRKIPHLEFIQMKKQVKQLYQEWVNFTLTY